MSRCQKARAKYKGQKSQLPSAANHDMSGMLAALAINLRLQRHASQQEQEQEHKQRFKHPIQKLQNISTKQPQDLEIQAGAYKSLKVQQMHNIARTGNRFPFSILLKVAAYIGNPREPRECTLLALKKKPRDEDEKAQFLLNLLYHHFRQKHFG
ncbi:hypothetical protein H5410_029975 [Solanum commersonii]|uniref:Uncharacterized protein n=1 Tax=Solanum commersonii TaxID=4109 RepID=A0A9J5YET1_SOLCO|nr:hypothetical protein H5410_029975 [Solanum commersonii]